MCTRTAQSLFIFALLLSLSTGCAQGSSGSSSTPTPSPSPTPPTPKGDGGVDPPDPNWRAAVGSGGQVAQSFDDATWQVRTVAPGGEDLYSVHCVSSRLGWVAGDRGLILRTEDSGRSWTQLPSGAQAPLFAIRFAEGGDGKQGRIGLAAGAGGTLLVSRDGGDSWRQVKTAATQALRSVLALRGGHVLLAAGEDGALLRSIDDGQSFALTRPGQQGSEPWRALAGQDDGGRVLLLSTDGALLTSADSGATWQAAEPQPAGATALGLQHDGPLAVIAGLRGLLRRQDEGGRWTDLQLAGAQDLRAALVASDGRHVYLAGDGGGFFVSEDRGDRFRPVPLPATFQISALEDF